MIITLTDQERDKFVAYLRQEAETADGMAKQIEKAMDNPAGKMAAKRHRTEAAASVIVAQILESWERVEIRG